MRLPYGDMHADCVLSSFLVHLGLVEQPAVRRRLLSLASQPPPLLFFSAHDNHCRAFLCHGHPLCYYSPTILNSQHRFASSIPFLLSIGCIWCSTHLLQQLSCCMALSLVSICTLTLSLSPPTTASPASFSTLVADLCYIDYNDLLRPRHHRHRLSRYIDVIFVYGDLPRLLRQRRPSSSSATYFDDYLDGRQCHKRFFAWHSLSASTPA